MMNDINRDQGYKDVCSLGPRDKGSGEAMSLKGKSSVVLPGSHKIWKFPFDFG